MCLRLPTPRHEASHGAQSSTLDYSLIWVGGIPPPFRVGPQGRPVHGLRRALVVAERLSTCGRGSVTRARPTTPAPVTLPPPRPRPDPPPPPPTAPRAHPAAIAASPPRRSWKPRSPGRGRVRDRDRAAARLRPPRRAAVQRRDHHRRAARPPGSGRASRCARIRLNRSRGRKYVRAERGGGARSRRGAPTGARDGTNGDAGGDPEVSQAGRRRDPGRAWRRRM